MNKILVGAGALILSATATQAFAAPDTPFFVGVMLGDTTLALDSRTYVTDEPPPTQNMQYTATDSQTYSLMVHGGYRFTDMIGIEAQLLTTLIDDKVYGTIKVNNNALSEMHSSVSAAGVYALFHFGEDAFVEGRLGIAQDGAKFDSDYASESFSSGAGYSYGLSVGQKLGGIGSVELMYMRYPDVKIDKEKFADAFISTAPYGSYTTIRNELRLEVLMIGYVFQF